MRRLPRSEDAPVFGDADHAPQRRQARGSAELIAENMQWLYDATPAIIFVIPGLALAWAVARRHPVLPTLIVSVSLGFGLAVALDALINLPRPSPGLFIGSSFFTATLIVLARLAWCAIKLAAEVVRHDR